MRIVFAALVLLVFSNISAQKISTVGGVSTTGGKGICLGNPFTNSSHINTPSENDYAQFRLLAGVACSFYLHSTLNSMAAAGSVAGFHIQTNNIANLISGVSIETYLNNNKQETASGSNLLSLLNGESGDIYFKTTKAYDALRINFDGLLIVASSVKIYWGYGDNSPVQTLPVSFQKFNLKQNAQSVDLQWELENFSDVEKLIVEKSVDGIHFNTLTIINEVRQSAQHFIDPTSGKAWYRLKAVSHSGKVIYSQVLLQQPNVSNSFYIFPNPVKGHQLYIQSGTDNNTGFVIIDINGRTVKKGKVVNETPINIENLSKGFYYLKLNKGASYPFLRN